MRDDARGQNELRRLIWLMSFVLCALSLPLHAASKWPLPDGVKSIEVNGYDMAFQESGSGVPLVLVHGALNDYRAWDAQFSEFAKARIMHRLTIAAGLSARLRDFG